jgi:hypothetical protein
LIATLAALALAGPARAEESKPAGTTASIMTFFKHLKESLSQSAVSSERKHAGRRGSSVAAVRGASQNSAMADPNEPSLKGDARSKKEKAAMAEDAEFAKGVDLVLAGKVDEGVKALEDFKVKHPKSHSLEKVQEAIDQAKALAAQKPAAVPAPAAQAAAPEPPKAEAAKADAPKADAPKAAEAPKAEAPAAGK